MPAFGYADDVDQDPREFVGGTRGAKRWTLLFEMGSNRDLDLWIWDYYSLQIMIRTDDLAARRDATTARTPSPHAPEM
jgi:hypothetical protein